MAGGRITKSATISASAAPWEGDAGREKGRKKNKFKGGARYLIPRLTGGKLRKEFFMHAVRGGCAIQDLREKLGGHYKTLL